MTFAKEPRPAPPYVVLGTDPGLDLWQAWAGALNRPAAVEERKKHRLWPPYPGFQVAFGHVWSEEAERRYSIDRDSLLQASRKADPHERCYAVVQHFLDQFPRTKKLDVPLAVAVCVVPDEVWTNCRPESHVTNPIDKALPRSVKQSRKAGQLELFEEFDPEQYHFLARFPASTKSTHDGL